LKDHTMGQSAWHTRRTGKRRTLTRPKRFWEGSHSQNWAPVRRMGFEWPIKGGGKGSLKQKGN